MPSRWNSTPELEKYLEDLGPFKGIRHPLVYSVPYMGKLMNATLNEMLAYKKERLAEARAAKNWHQILFLHERPYRLQALAEIAWETGTDYWGLVRYAWVDTENAHQNIKFWKQLFSSNRPGREDLMMEEERQALAELPEEFTVYRGVDRKAGEAGIAWTTDMKMAQWFAKRFGKKGYVVSGKVKKSDVTAYILSRGESEIITLKVQGIRKM